MSHTELILKNPRTDKLKAVPLGYSWTVMFFGFFVPLWRKDWKYSLIFFLIYALSIGSLTPVMAYYYNRLYALELLRRGYKLFNIQGRISPHELNKLRSKIPDLA